MKYILPIIIMFFPNISMSQPMFSEPPSPLREFVRDQDKPWIGRMLIENAVEFDPFPPGAITRTETVTINVDGVGEFMFSSEVSKNDQCPFKDCPDVWEIVEWPQGYAVFPPILSIDEHSIGTFYIYPWLGV